MTMQEKLACALCFEGGHLTDEALVLLADGQASALDESAVTHGESCEACAARLAAFAVESADVGRAMAAVRDRLGAFAQRSKSDPPRPLAAPPWWAMALAVGLAVLGAVPATIESGPGMATALADAPHRLNAWAHGVVTLLALVGQTPVGVVAPFAAALCLVASGIVVARRDRHAST
jgi:hypothetical protein